VTLADAPWGGLAVALGCGLLVGLERERRKGQGPERAAAGLRSFMLASMTGALAQTLAPVAAPGLLVALGALAVIALAVASYVRSAPRDPGLTTELALIVMYLVGVQCVVSPAFGAASGTVLAVLLAARERMHRFATELLTEHELRDALVLASVALVLVPLAPAEPSRWLGGLAPRTLVWLVLLVLSLQAAAHVARRLLGARRALALSGFLGGFVSSTATVASFGAQARGGAMPPRAAAGAATLSGAATWLQALAVASVVQPAALGWLVAPALAGAVVAALAGAALLWRVPPDGAPVGPAGTRSALRLRESVLVAALIGAVSAGVGLAQARFGASGVFAGAALAALADAHAAIASVLALQRAAQIDAAQALQAALLAVSVNTVSRAVVAWAGGGARYGAEVATGLALSAAAAWGVASAAAPG